MNFKFIGKYPTYTYLIAIYFGLCPLEFALNNVSGGSSIKYLGAIILILMLAGAYKNNKRLNIRSYQILILLWLILITASVLWCVSYSTAYIYLSSYIGIILFYVVLTAFNYSKSELKLFLESMYIGSVISVIMVVIYAKPYHGGERDVIYLFGANSEPNNLAAFIVLSTTYSLWKIIESRVYHTKVLNLIIFLLTFIALFKTGSRTGFITGVLSSIIIFLGHIFIDKRLRFLKMLKIAFGSLIFIAILLYLLNQFVSPYLLDRIFNFQGYQGGSDRVELWSYGYQLFQDKILLGYGLGSYLAITSRVLHNTYFTVFFETGIIGGLLFISFLMNIILKIIKYKQYLIFSLLLSGLVPAFFIDSMNKRFFWNALIICSLMINNYLKEKSWEKS